MVAQKENSQAKKRAKKLGNRWWRLRNLYWIMDEKGREIHFKPNVVQTILYFALWWLNVIPKSRQHGITTFISIFILDACLFNSNIRAGIIAHKLADAKKIFRDKIHYAYDRLPDDIKVTRQLIKDDSQELLFSNNSSIYVGTSMRSGTLQYLHVSEYAWLCVHAPKKAKEIKTGAMETVHEGGMIFVESTAEGSFGDFKDMCDEAEKKRQMGDTLSPMDYRIHFFAWHQKQGNTTDPTLVIVPEEMHKYFNKLEEIFKKKITPGQRAWYAQKKKRLKHDMFKEHPSTLEEAFIASVEGAYYADEMAQIREEGRICRVPHLPQYPTHTVNDLGLGGNMPWIFWQKVGLECHIINCFNLSEKDDVAGGAVFYKRMLDNYREKYNYSYGEYFCPFDAKKGEIGTGQSIKDTFKLQGVDFTVLELEANVLDGIQRLRNLFPVIYIDAVNCQPLIVAWSSYHREWIEKNGVYSHSPAPDKSTHYADAGRYLAKAFPIVKTGSMSKERWRQLKAKHS
ncbi:hypothetical protein LCGC14_2213310 [marine sediment metagenome]|uniref:Terminase large subunit gp17-like C-terminal domain-containing protein n=1 Tax=marine sediment metagenome TaxID=412755 RepID=A0A0F9DD99_9ZZZZ